jgi:hypothetical protein
MDSDDLRKLVRLQAKQIAELEEQIEEFEGDEEPEQDDAELSRLASENFSLRQQCKDRDNLKIEVAELIEQLANARKANEAHVRERDERQPRLDGLRQRIQQLEGEARERKTYVQKRIEAALGEYTGDWLQEAEERLTRRREISPTEVGRVITSAVASAKGDLAKLAHEVCEYLAVTLPKDGP